jgi:hypothetical protein
MERKTEIIIAVSVLALLLLVIAFILMKNRTGGEGGRDGNIPVANGVLDVPSVNSEDIPANPTVEARTITKIFVERFGSYSSESDFANVDDVVVLAAASFKNDLIRLADQSRAKAKDTDGYYGVSTKVIGTEMKEETATTARMLAMTQREEAVGNPGNTTIKYQNIMVTLAREGEEWKVSGFTWEE